MMTRILLSILLLPVLAPAPARGAGIRLTLVSARLNPAALPKHEHPRSLAPLSDLACLSLPGLRHLADACGTQPEGKSERHPVDAMVRLELGDRVIRTYPIPGTLTPRWEYSVVVDEAFLGEVPQAEIFLYDYHGPSDEHPLGSAPMSAKDLMRPGTRQLSVGGAQLTYKVERVADKGGRSYKFRVPANRQMAELARQITPSAGGYGVIPVSEGETVEIAATGQVRPNARKYPERVAGPNGIPTIQAKIQFNQPGFRGCPGCNHAALVAQIGASGMVIGEHKKFVVESSGFLVLAINDLKVEDNDGGFDVSVAVTLPATSDAPRLTKGSTRDAGMPAMDQRVVQQVIDGHMSEIDACVSGEPNPYGDIVFSLAISADGRPLGVSVEKASPNLRKAAECMRKKALRWKFPPPRGVMVARYPLSFSPG